jgi:phage tail sheath protein FI
LGVLQQDRPNGLASAFIQLAYPWVRTSVSAILPEGLESPDGVLAGMLARNALQNGAFRSAANLGVGDVYDVFPVLRRDQMLISHADQAGGHSLTERVSLLGPTPRGLALLSDVTTSLDESYRPASVNRLVSIITRAARRLGEDLLFEASGERLWAQIAAGMQNLLFELLQAGALQGSTPTEAFSVRCDRSTMTQNDLDNGRVVAEIQFAAAAPIETITIVLTLSASGQISLSTDSTKGMAA